MRRKRVPQWLTFTLIAMPTLVGVFINLTSFLAALFGSDWLSARAMSLRGRHPVTQHSRVRRLNQRRRGRPRRSKQITGVP